VVQSVAVSAWDFPGEADCEIVSAQAWAKRFLGSGHGLRVNQRCEGIQEIYGTPESSESSVSGRERLESYAYTFESNRRNAALKLEATCETSSNRVTKIQLKTVEALAQ
jgi:hypothetical protein